MSTNDTGKIELDIERRRLSRAGEEITLAPQDWAVLENLDRNVGNMVTRDELIEEVWGAGSNTSLDKSISNIRIALGQIRKGQRYDRKLKPSSEYWIETVHGKGFIFRRPAIQSTDYTSIPLEQTEFVSRINNKGINYVEHLEHEFTKDTKRRLITLWGRIGVGKSRTALEVRNRLRDRHGFKCIWSSARGRNFYFQTLLKDIVRELNSGAELEILDELARRANTNLALGLLKKVEGRCLIVLDDLDKMDPDEEQACLDWLSEYAPCCTLVTSNHRTQFNNIQLQEMSDKEAEEFVKQLIVQMVPEEEIRFTAKEVIKTLNTTAPLFLVDGVSWLGRGYSLDDAPKLVFGSKAESRQELLRRQIGENAYRIMEVLFHFVKRDASYEALIESSGLSDNREQFEAALSTLTRFGLITRRVASNRIALDEHARHIREKEIEVSS